MVRFASIRGTAVDARLRDACAMQTTAHDLASLRELLDGSGASPFRQALLDICAPRCGGRMFTFPKAE